MGHPFTFASMQGAVYDRLHIFELNFNSGVVTETNVTHRWKLTCLTLAPKSTQNLGPYRLGTWWLDLGRYKPVSNKPETSTRAERVWYIPIFVNGSISHQSINQQSRA